MKEIIPDPIYGRGNNKYNLSSLKCSGDVVFFAVPATDKKTLHSIRDAAYKFAKYHKIKIATRHDGQRLGVYYCGKI